MSTFFIELFQVDYKFEYRRRKTMNKFIYKGAVYNTPDAEDLSDDIMYWLEFERPKDSWDIGEVIVSNVNHSSNDGNNASQYELDRPLVKVLKELFVEGIKSKEQLDKQARRLLFEENLITF